MRIIQKPGPIGNLKSDPDGGGVGAVEAADVVATSINCLSEETLQDALASVHAEIEDDAAAA